MNVVDPLFTQTFDLRHYELDTHGKLSFPYLCRMLQETAGRHASSLNISSDLLRQQGMTWILSRFHVKRVDTKSQWPGWKQVMTIQTWRAALERLFAIRDYRVLNAAGDELAVATSHWAVLDTQARRVVAIPSFVKDSHPMSGDRALDSPYAKLPALERVDYSSSLKVTLQHIDENKHVNNVSYLDWLIDALPESISTGLDLREFEILFRAESVLGDDLICETQKVSDGTFLHRIYKQGASPGTSKDVVHARTIWA